MQNWIKYLLILPLLLNSVLNFGQNQNMLKQFLTVEEGLSHNEVTSIVQDNDGFIWIGTRGGLNRYDGYEFKVFNQIPGDSNSLVNPSIESLFVDSKGNIWIGTKSGGVSKYNPYLETFKNIISNYKNSSNFLPSNRILSFFEDRKGKIWIRIFPHTPITRKAAEVPMGSGKGSVDFYVARVKPGTVLFEIRGVSEEVAREAFRLAGHKLSVKTKLVFNTEI